MTKRAGSSLYLEMPCSGVRFEVIRISRGGFRTPRVHLRHVERGDQFWMEESDLVELLKRQRLSLFVRTQGRAHHGCVHEPTFWQVSGPGRRAVHPERRVQVRPFETVGRPGPDLSKTPKTTYADLQLRMERDKALALGV